MRNDTLEGLLKEGTAALKCAGITEAGLDAWLLLEYITEKNRAYYYAHAEEAVEETKAAHYRQLIEKRAGHIPLQHLTHQAFFMGYEFYVNEHVLIPRQDTEVLVEEALRLMKSMNEPKILDMCTGSGCILLSLLLEKEGRTGTGADISEEALKVAKRNAEANNVTKNADFVKSDIFSALYFCKICGNESLKYDMLISNPPYIPTKEIDGLMEEVRFHDPRLALDGKEDGLYFYRRITEESKEYLKKGGWLLYEIGCEQGPDVAGIMRKAGFTDVEIKKDLAGLDRVVLGRKPL